MKNGSAEFKQNRDPALSRIAFYSRAKASIGFKRAADRAGIKPKPMPIAEDVSTAAIIESSEKDMVMLSLKLDKS